LSRFWGGFEAADLQGSSGKMGWFARSILVQDKDPTAVAPPGRSQSPAMRGFSGIRPPQSV